MGCSACMSLFLWTFIANRQILEIHFLCLCLPELLCVCALPVSVSRCVSLAVFLGLPLIYLVTDLLLLSLLLRIALLPVRQPPAAACITCANCAALAVATTSFAVGFSYLTSHANRSIAMVMGKSTLKNSSW